MPSTKLNSNQISAALIAWVLLGLVATISARAEPLRQLRSISSTNGVLQADLVIKNSDIILNGREIPGLRTYNGEFTGPTLRTHPGDVMKIRYINRLSEDIAHAGGSHDRVYSSVNLHTHGLNVSPEGFSDNVYLEILPGQWVPFEIHIPTNHPTGLFWYHPHRHHAASSQVGCALTGNLIITGKGDLDEIPEVAAAKKVEMIFNEIPLQPITAPEDPHQLYGVPDNPTATFFAGGQFPFPLPPGFSPSYKIFTLNGAPVLELDSTKTNPTTLPLPEITMLPGEVQHWHLTHAGINRFLDLVLVDANNVNQPLYLLAFDGITVPTLQGITNGILLGDGNRVDFLVKAGAAGSVYHFKAIPTTNQLSDQQGGFDIPLATATVQGAPVTMNLPSTLNPPISRLPDIKDQEIVRYRTNSFEVDQRNGIFTDNGAVFDPLIAAKTMLLDTAEEWLLTTVGLGSDVPLAHPFHIHVNWFQVVKINGVPVPPRWQDTVVIPFGGTVTIRSRFQQYPGRFVLHCHILPHEDEGMMAGVEVVDPNHLNPLQAWRMTNFNSFENFGKSANTTNTLGGPLNIYHYAYGVSATNSSGFPAAQTVKTEGTDFKFDWRVMPAGVTNPVAYALFDSSDLINWNPTTSAVVGTPVDKGNGFQTVVLRDTKPFSGQARRFVTVTLQTEPLALPITPDLPQ